MKAVLLQAAIGDYRQRVLDLLVEKLGRNFLFSVWLLLIRKILNRKSVLWGHAWPRGGRYKRSDRPRNLMRRLRDAIVVYPEAQARELVPDPDVLTGRSILMSPGTFRRPVVRKPEPLVRTRSVGKHR